MSPQGRTMQISELSRRAGVPRHTIHYYLRKGVLHPSVKVGQTRALYDESHLERLLVIKKVRQRSGSPLSFIAAQFTDGKVEKKKTAKVKAGGGPARSVSKRAKINAEKKQRIMAAGIDLFSSQGYHHTSVKAVVARAGFSTGTFYLHFKSKKDLFSQVVVEAVRASVDRIEKIMRKEKDIFVRNTKRIQELRAHHDLFTEVLTQLRMEMYTDEDYARDRFQKVYFELTRPFIYEIQQALKQRIIRPVDPDLLTFLMIGICDIMLFRQTLDDRYDTNQIIAFVFDVLLDGLRLRTDTPSTLSADGKDGASKGLTEAEKAWLALLRQTGYNQAEAARMMGKTRQAVTNYLKRHPCLKDVVDRERTK